VEGAPGSFSPALTRSLERAEQAARADGRREVLPEDLLIGLAAHAPGLMHDVLGVQSPAAAWVRMEALIDVERAQAPHAAGTPRPLDGRAADALEEACRLAAAEDAREVQPEHLLLGLSRHAEQAVAWLAFDPAALRERLRRARS
jgi:ATP-dependent Clp protease ATP-binding subunit ClpA